MERSPALPLLPPCPLPHPIPQASVCGFGEGVNGSGASKGCKPRDHSCLLPPCSRILGRGDLRQALDFYQDFHLEFLKPFIIWLQLTFPDSPPPLPGLHTPACCVAHSHPSLVRPHLLAACPLPKRLTRSTFPFPHLDRGDILACSHHIWLCGPSL